MKVALLAAIAGSILASIMLCIVLLLDGSRIHSSADVLFLPAVGFIAGITGLLVSFPAVLVLGAPLVWLFGDRFAHSPRRFALLLAIVGGIVGWLMFLILFGDPRSMSFDEGRYACLIFGAVVAGLHAPLAAWLAEPDEMPLRPEVLAPSSD